MVLPGRANGVWQCVIASIAILAFGLFSPGGACGDAIPPQIGYSTSGWISRPWVSGPISFQGLSGATLNTSETFPLGGFVIVAEPGVTTTYTDTPFAIDFTAPQFHRVVDAAHSPNGSLTQYDGIFEVEGHLNGTVNANGQSNVVAAFDRVVPFEQYVALTTDRVYLSGLPFLTSDVTLPQTLALTTGASGAGTFLGGPIVVTAQITPEPGAWALYVLAILASTWRLRRRKAAA